MHAQLRYNTDLLFYDASAGTGEFYATFWANDGQFGITLLRTHTDWRPSWTQIIPGRFVGKWNVIPDGRSVWIGFTDLLFYDAGAGIGDFWTTDGQGRISRLRTHTDWRTSWTQIIPGQFGGSGFTDLLFYDASDGTGEFYTTDGQGRILGPHRYTDWRRTWTRIVPGRFNVVEPVPDLPELEP